MAVTRDGSADPSRDGAARRPGVLTVIAEALSQGFAVTLLLLAASLPTLAGLLLLQPVPGNLPLYALVAVPLGPAAGAALHCSLRRLRGEELEPWRDFRHGYRICARDVLRVWLPLLAVLAAAGWYLAALDALGGAGSGVARGVLLAGGLLLPPVAVNALLIAVRMRFRTRDVWRLAAWQALRCPRASLASWLVLAAAVALAAVGTEAVLVPLAGPLLHLLALGGREVVADVEARFTTDPTRPTPQEHP